jgi:hypothetical protein
MGIEQIGAQVSHESVFLPRGEHSHVVQAEAHRYPVLRGQYCPGLMTWPSPARSGSVKVPGTVHPEMRMQASSVVEPGEQVLADALYAQHSAP